MNFDDFTREAQRLRLKLPRETRHDRRIAPLLSNEALFQLPFLAIVILVLSKGSRKPTLPQLGQLVGECIEASMPGFKSSDQQISWSANLRIRTVKALTFLEMSQLITVAKGSKTIAATELGRRVLERASVGDTSLSNTLEVIERSYRNLSAEAQIRLEV